MSRQRGADDGIRNIRLKKLVELGRFPSADSAVNEVILRTFSDLSDRVLAQSTLPDAPIAFDDQLQQPNFPYRTRQPLATVTIAGQRLPDPMTLCAPMERTEF